jgi:hypothetical protein
MIPLLFCSPEDIVRCFRACPGNIEYVFGGSSRRHRHQPVAATACPGNIVKYYREVVAGGSDTTGVGYRVKRRTAALPHLSTATL